MRNALITPTMNKFMLPVFISGADTKVVAHFDQQFWGSTTVNILL